MNRRLSHWWLLLLLIPLVIGLARLRFDVEVLNLLPTDLPVVEGLKLYQRHFANANELILTVQSDDAETAETTARQLALALRKQTNLVSRALWQAPGREHPEQMAELLALTWLNQPPEVFSQLADRLAPARLAATLEAARNELATSLSPETIARRGYDPLGLSSLPETVATQAGGFGQDGGLFAASDGTFRLIFLKPAAALGSYRDCVAWLERLRQAVESIRHAQGVPDNVRVGYTGAPAFIAEIASGMERDMSGSAFGTLLVVAVLFWWAHRRLLPLAWLTALLVLVLAATLALGGLIYGVLNVISLGFAAILIGLTDDYPAVLYQEALDHPHLSAADIRRKCTPAIVSSAVTTAGAFLLLNFAALPGLAQLGTLVALGIMLAAVVMLYGFLPIALKRRSRSGELQTSPVATTASFHPTWFSSKLAWLVTFTLLVATLTTLWRRPPAMDHSAEALNPTASPAHAAMKDVESHFAGTADPLLILISGRDEAEVGERMELLEARVKSPDVQRWLGTVTFPTALWPRPAWQQINRATAASLCEQRDVLRAAVLGAGFNNDGFHLADSILQTWKHAGATSGVAWPRNEASQWLLEKVAARTEGGWLALGIAQPTTNSAAAFAGAVAALGATLAENGARLTGWSALGEAMLIHAEERLPWLVAAMLLLVGLCLRLAFRDWREVLLSFLAVGAAFLALLTLMSLLGWSWNLMNLMAAPLLLGAGVDYTIHTQLALRRNDGDIAAFRRTTGRALLLASATTIVGFASLAWAGNAGLASLGRLCAAGLVCALVVSVGLLPVWWRALEPTKSSIVMPGKPSLLYRREIWWLGLWLGRILPATFCQAIARVLGLMYWRLNPRRRAVVIENLLPACDGSHATAEHAARRLFQEFAVKVADLWRFESGAAVDCGLRSWSGWETFEAARARGKGVLLITPHLGNWEFGGPLLADRGINLVVLTQAEPGKGLTALRQKSRARWGIETIVVGQDAFAFVEIIKRLQDGATIALLVDRPPAPRAATVQLFGRRFNASIAAAELARATGCAIVPVSVLREAGGYAAHILPEIAYDRAAIGNREARVRLTQEIMRAFEPVIRQHVTQWYHFVPIWPEHPDARK